MVVHDMRSPISVLMTLLDLVRTDPKCTLERVYAAQDLQFAGPGRGRASSPWDWRTISSMWDVSRLGGEQAAARSATARPHRRSAARYLRAAGPARSARERRSWSSTPPRPRLWMRPAAIVLRVLENLVINAMKHTPGGRAGAGLGGRRSRARPRGRSRRGTRRAARSPLEDLREVRHGRGPSREAVPLGRPRIDVLQARRGGSRRLHRRRRRRPGGKRLLVRASGVASRVLRARRERGAWQKASPGRVPKRSCAGRRDGAQGRAAGGQGHASDLLRARALSAVMLRGFA